MFIIFSDQTDSHSNAIKWGIMRSGFDCITVDLSDFKKDHDDLVVMSTTLEKPVFRINGRYITADEIDCIWFRKLPVPFSSPLKNSGNYTLFEKANIDESIGRFSYEFLVAISQCVPTINSPLTSGLALYKSTHILAKTNELKTPFSIMTSDLGFVAAEFEKRGLTECVHKPIRHNVWQHDTEGRTKPSTKVSIGDLKNYADKQQIPGIFQEVILKAREYRVIVFDESCIVLKQEETQSGNGHDIDWRFIKTKLSVLHGEMKQKIVDLVLPVTKDLNLAHCSIDVALDMNGDLWMLDINPYGQFLGYDLRIKGADILRSATEFLLSRAHKSIPTEVTILVQDFLSEWDEEKQGALEDTDSSDLVSRLAVSIFND